jgi:putative oxidoreductase
MMVFGQRPARAGEIVLRAALTALFLVAAGMKLAAVPFETAGFARFGYAPWFMTVIGLAQLLGAVLLWVPGWTGLAALGLGAMMVGAVGSHLRAGDPVAMAAPALVLVVVLFAIAFVRRREILARLPGRLALPA